MEQKKLTLHLYTENPTIEQAHLAIEQIYVDFEDMKTQLFSSCEHYRQNMVNYQRIGFLKELPKLKVKISNSNFLDDEKALHLSKKLEHEHFNDIYKKANKNELFKTRKISYDDFPEPFLNYGKMLEEHSKQKRLVINYLETKEQRNEMFAEYNQELLQENTPKNGNKPKP